MYSDAHTFGLKSANSTAISNSNLAIFWLEATFPELAQQATDGENPSTIKAHSHALFHASLALQVCEIMGLLTYLRDAFGFDWRFLFCLDMQFLLFLGMSNSESVYHSMITFTENILWLFMTSLQHQ